MFYRIKDNKIYDYADYEYAQDCLFTNICSKKVFEENRDCYVIENGQIAVAPDLDEILAEKRKEEFENSFFLTSLGWIRRKVTMKDGTVKDFLGDLLLPVKAGMELGQSVEIITYKTPDFSKNMDIKYMESLQELKLATVQFIQECLFQTVKDFRGEDASSMINTESDGGNNGI